MEKLQVKEDGVRIPEDRKVEFLLRDEDGIFYLLHRAAEHSSL